METDPDILQFTTESTVHNQSIVDILTTESTVHNQSIVDILTTESTVHNQSIVDILTTESTVHNQSIVDILTTESTVHNQSIVDILTTESTVHNQSIVDILTNNTGGVGSKNRTDVTSNTSHYDVTTDGGGRGGGDVTKPPVRHDLLCGQTEMSFRIPVSEDMLPLPKTVTLSDPSCAVQISEVTREEEEEEGKQKHHFLSGSTVFNGCGTTARFTNHSVIFSNFIVLDYSQGTAAASPSVDNSSDDSYSKNNGSHDVTNSSSNSNNSDSKSNSNNRTGNDIIISSSNSSNNSDSYGDNISSKSNDSFNGFNSNHKNDSIINNSTTNNSNNSISSINSSNITVSITNTPYNDSDSYLAASNNNNTNDENSNNNTTSNTTNTNTNTNNAIQIIPLECHYERASELHLSFLPLVRQVLFTETGVGRFQFQIEQFQDSSFAAGISQSAYPLRTSPSEEVFVQLSLGEMLGQHLDEDVYGMDVEGCVASPLSSWSEARRGVHRGLIVDGCPVSKDVRLHEVQSEQLTSCSTTCPLRRPRSHGDPRVFRFSFKAAVAPADLEQMSRSRSGSSLVYIHCRVRLCPATSCLLQGRRCEEVPTSTLDRRRRDVGKGGEGHGEGQGGVEGEAGHQLSTGPLLIVVDSAGEAADQRSVVIYAVPVPLVIAFTVIIVAAALVTLAILVAWKRRGRGEGHRSLKDGVRSV
ncbi:uncharacterized protein LOC143300800 [Babylonia areolata]|uniref:uncharacterized protein LOC143300800 n=1 Tax=Babylonia areolata TaxID=304850 RepID=UPI003FD62B62